MFVRFCQAMFQVSGGFCHPIFRAFTKFCESVHVMQNMSEAGDPYDTGYLFHGGEVLRSELLVKWVLPKTRGIKAGVQVVLIK